MVYSIQIYTSENNDNLDLRLYKVRNLGIIELSKIEVKFLSVNDLPGIKFEFDVAVQTELEFRA